MGYQDVLWVDDQDIDDETMNRMAQNDRWLYNNMPTGYYRAWGIKKSTGLRIACGVATNAPQKSKYMTGNVSFGNYFNSLCKPIVVVTHTTINHAYQRISGPGHGQIPDSTGFKYHLISNPEGKTTNHFPNTVYVHWVAIGWS